MAIVFRELDDLISHFKGVVRLAETVSIDGKDGIGKTHLAKELAQAIGAEHLELDTFLERNRGGYVPFIRFGELARRLDECLRADRAIVIDGLCMELIWERLGKTPTYRVYIKRMGPGPPVPYWKDEGEFVDRAPEDLIKAWTQSANVLNEMWARTRFRIDDAFDREVLLYHHLKHPHERADVIFERIET